MTRLFLLSCLLSTLESSSQAHLRAVPMDPNCQDILQEKFHFATQVKITNVLCTAHKDLAYLDDLIIDHLAMPFSFSESEETDVCRTGPAPNEPCAGYLAEGQHESSAGSDQQHQQPISLEPTFEWNWRGIGSCGIFQPNPNCHPNNDQKSIQRVLDVHRLSERDPEDEKEIPDFSSKTWLSPDQKAALQELVAQRDALIAQDNNNEKLLDGAMQDTVELLVSKEELAQIIERNHGREKQILLDILELYTVFESEMEELKPKLQAFENNLKTKLDDLLWRSLQGSCFVERPQIDIVITPMATRDYAVAYVKEQC